MDCYTNFQKNCKFEIAVLDFNQRIVQPNNLNKLSYEPFKICGRIRGEKR